MKLKEFDLDAPKATKAERQAFRLSTRCMSALYARCFPGLNVGGGWKILVECLPERERADVRNLLGVFTVQIPFAVESYLASSPPSKKAMAVEALHRGVLDVASIKGWPTTPFEQSVSRVKDLEYTNEWSWPKPQSNPDKKFVALLSCSHEPDAFRAWLVVRDASQQVVARALVVEDPPSEFIFTAKMGQVVWVSPQRVVLKNKQGSEIGFVDLPPSLAR